MEVIYHTVSKQARMGGHFQRKKHLFTFLHVKGPVRRSYYVLLPGGTQDIKMDKRVALGRRMGMEQISWSFADYFVSPHS